MKSYLYAPGRHFKLFGKLVSERGIWLGVALKDTLQSSELRARSSFPVLDFIGGVRVERTEVGGDVWRDGMVWV